MMQSLIPWFQALAGIAWAGCFCLIAPAGWRYLRHHEVTPRNVRAVLIAFIALNQTGFSLRWLIYDHTVVAMGATEISLWAALYLCSAIGAVTVALTTNNGLFDA